MKHKNIGDSFDSFLEKEGIREQAEDVATKRVIAYQLQEEMKKQNISQKALAQKMRTSRSSIKRLLDPQNDSLTLNTLKKAAKMLGKRVQIELV